MTAAQRKILENFAGNDTPLCRAIAAALAEIDRLRMLCGEAYGEFASSADGDTPLMKDLRLASEKERR